MSNDFVSDFREIKERLLAACRCGSNAAAFIEIRKAINIADEWLGDDEC